jgi:heme exporter protein C
MACVRFLALAAGTALAFCQWLIHGYAPLERTMGQTYKILYLHLPAAWWAMFSFLIVCAASIAYLRRRDPFWDALAGAAAETGALLAALALITGSIWGRHSWGVWWTWDPRLTTTLIMFFLYAGYLVLRRQDIPAERRRLLCAVAGIAAFADVPLVFASARLWQSVHPVVFASGGGLEPEMRLTVLACVLASGLLWAALLILRVDLARLEERLARLEEEA